MSNNLKNTLCIYGGKYSDDFMRGTLPLMPTRLVGVVDCFMGGGGISANLFDGLGDIQKIGIEKDPSMMAFHKAVKNHPMGLMKQLEKIEYTRDFYDKCMDIIQRYRNGEAIDELKVATATYATVFMNRNGMRCKSFRSLTPNSKYLSEPEKYIKKQRELDAIKWKLYDRIPFIVHDMNLVLKDMALITDSAMNHTDLWERKDWLCVCDVPYLFSKRGIADKRKTAGYLDEWQDEDHQRFIDAIVEKQKKGAFHCKMWICSNFEIVQGTIPREELKKDPYVRALLPLGWRMVVVQKKFSSSIISDKLLERKKKIKVEVIFMNYTDIVGSWEDYCYYTYNSVFNC